jgi:hypothetical protein
MAAGRTIAEPERKRVAIGRNLALGYQEKLGGSVPEGQ